MSGEINHRKRRFQPVFTPAGCAVLFVSLIALVRSLVMRNSYEIVIFSAALLLLLVLGITGAWKTVKLKSMETGWKPPCPMTAGFYNSAGSRLSSSFTFNEETDITGLNPLAAGSAIPLFFRLHFIIKGRFFPCGNDLLSGEKTRAVKNKTPRAYSNVLVETSIRRGDTGAKILLDFPMSGIFRGDGFCQLRDIFGLFSFNCGGSQERTVMVRSSPCYGKKTVINAQTGAEDRRSKPSADEERYYMREYTPGDRLRDINWKSSEKIDSLITRISTDNQEKITRIEVHFRNYGEASSLDALWLLDRAKAQLSYFLRSLMEQNSSFVFDVCSAGKNWELEDMDDLDEFFDELAGISLMPLRNDAGFQGAVNKGDVYVFSTACDTGLPGFLIANSQRPVSLFLIQPPDTAKQKFENEERKTIVIERSEESKKAAEAKTEMLFLKNFPAMGCGVHPRWFSRGKIKPIGVAGKADVFYAKVKF